MLHSPSTTCLKIDHPPSHNGLQNARVTKYNNLRLSSFSDPLDDLSYITPLLTNARRVEIFSSTVTYAAVLVVFASENLGPDTTAGN